MNKLRYVFIAVGVVLLIGAIGLTVYNMWDDARAQKSAENVLAELEKKIPDSVDGTPDYKLNPDMEMPTEKIDGEEYIGTLSIPTLELELPVMSEWNYNRLMIAPCRYTGSVYKNDMVIAAHNYTHHFGRLKKLSIGDPIKFKDVDGNIFEYSVTALEILQPTAVDEMKKDNHGLTLFTCTIGGRTRVTVRCEAVKQQ